MTSFVQIVQNSYPERLGMICIVEINWIFKIAFTVLKPFLSKRTLDKVINFSYKVVDLIVAGSIRSAIIL